MKADEIISAAREQLDVPFLHQGRSRQGLDCIGLLLTIADKFKVPYTDVEGYNRLPQGKLLEETFNAHVASGQLIKLLPHERQKGDFLMMRFKGQPQHLAVFTGSTIIHSYASVGKVCEHILDSTWEKRIVNVYRLAEVET